MKRKILFIHFLIINILQPYNILLTEDIKGASTCKLKFIQIGEELDSPIKRKVYKVNGMDFKNSDCNKEIIFFGNREIETIDGNSVHINFTKENINSWDFNNKKIIEKIFARVIKQPVGRSFQKDPFHMGYYK